MLDRTSDQWEASSAAEKCMFVQVLYHACKNYWEANPGQINPSSHGDQKIPGAPENKKSHGETLRTKFVNCQPKLMGGKICSASIIYLSQVAEKNPNETIPLPYILL